MVAHSSAVLVVVVLVTVPLTDSPNDVVVRQISAVSVSHLVGFSGSGIGPFVGILLSVRDHAWPWDGVLESYVMVGHFGKFPLMLMPGGKMIGGGPLYQVRIRERADG
jgi:hypothetical protein